MNEEEEGTSILIGYKVVIHRGSRGSCDKIRKGGGGERTCWIRDVGGWRATIEFKMIVKKSFIVGSGYSISFLFLSSFVSVAPHCVSFCF